ncbi:hypothetical protein ATJ93_4763 [Halopiger aswanensis]|uniref:Uncharacterized protein n=1 Tax=Halopiger aswanensis TaxID=148449 RepID=A0A419VUY3_9EURY|nr:hypothetical protein ATJ93_4763 [Halopiger aswanensis]
MITHPSRDKRINADLFRETRVSRSDISRPNWRLTLLFESDQGIEDKMPVLSQPGNSFPNATSFEFFSGIPDKILSNCLCITIAGKVTSFH